MLNNQIKKLMRTVKLKIKRIFLGNDYTIGQFFIEDSRYWETLEDKVRDFNKDGDLLDPGEDKVYGETAIPYGTYEVELTWSPKFGKKLPLIKDVKHFEGIRIHAGANAGHSEGCILLGENKIKGGLVNSKQRVDDFISWMEIETMLGTKFTLEIV